MTPSDLSTEAHSCHEQDLDTNSNAPLTSMMSDADYSQTFVAGFADGAVKVFDRRLDDEQAIVRSYTEHNSWVQNAKWLPKADRQPMSARYGYLR